MYDQINEIFSCFEGPDMCVSIQEPLSSIDDDETLTYLNNDIFAFRIHLISQAERPSIRVDI